MYLFGRELDSEWCLYLVVSGENGSMREEALDARDAWIKVRKPSNGVFWYALFAELNSMIG
jgi:hypothetical protein